MRRREGFSDTLTFNAVFLPQGSYFKVECSTNLSYERKNEAICLIEYMTHARQRNRYLKS